MRNVRAMAGLTLAQVAARSGVNKATVHKIETGTYATRQGPGVVTVDAILRACGATLLIERKDLDRFQ